MATYDVSGTADCVGKLSMLYDAYIAAVAGTARVVVRFNDRWTEYSKPNAPALLDLYLMMYRQCPGASAAGLPDLNPANKVKRGAPGRGYYKWPRL